MWWALPLERNSFHFGKDGMSQNMTGQIKKVNETGNYRRTKMKKEMVLQKLREQGCRITQQRQILLDIILEEDGSSCKEIFYRASKLDPGIGTATVYRLVNKLEEIGAISRRICIKLPAMRKMAAEKYAELRWRIILYGTCHQKTGMK